MQADNLVDRETDRDLQQSGTINRALTFSSEPLTFTASDSTQIINIGVTTIQEAGKCPDFLTPPLL